MASQRVVPPQNYFLYEREWIEEVDKFFINHLVHQQKLACWDNKVPVNSHALLYAQSILNDGFRKKFDLNYLLRREQILRDRARVFTKIVHSIEVYWYRDKNKVIASMGFWDTLAQDEPLAMAYYHMGETEYEKLVQLFGDSPSTPTSQTTEVINISSSTEIMPRQATHTYIEIDCETELSKFSDGESEASESVESPLISARKPPVRMINFGPFGPPCASGPLQSGPSNLGPYAPAGTPTILPSTLPSRRQCPPPPRPAGDVITLISSSQGSFSPGKWGSPSCLH